MVPTLLVDDPQEREATREYPYRAGLVTPEIETVLLVMVCCVVEPPLGPK
jgi:hypothetical protein